MPTIGEYKEIATLCGRGSTNHIDVCVSFHLGPRFFIRSIVSGIAMGAQCYFLSGAAATLTTRLRKLSFIAVVNQDSKHSNLMKNEN